MKRPIILLIFILMLKIPIATSHENGYSTTDLNSVLAFKSNIINLTKSEQKIGFDVRKIHVYLSISSDKIIINAGQKMAKDVNKLAQIKDKQEFDYVVKDYNKNLKLFDFIRQKDSKFSHAIYNEVQDNLHLLAELYKSKSDKNEKIKYINLISDSLDILFNSHSKTSDLLMHSKICNNFDNDIKYLCYQKFIISFVNRSDWEISLAVTSMFNNTIPWECHFLLHDLGFNIAQGGKLEDTEKCGNEERCTYGCQHGFAIGYLTKMRGSLNREEFVAYYNKSLNKKLTGLNLYHGFGHAFLGIFDNDSIALEKCKLLYNYTGDIRILNLCIAGLSHEKFFIKPDLNFGNFSKDFKTCSDFGEYGYICRLMASFGYSMEKLWHGNTSMEPVRKILDFCKEIDDEFCYYGIGFASASIASNRHQLGGYAAGLEGINECKKIFSEISMDKDYYCNTGAAVRALIFFGNTNLAFMACKDVINHGDKLKCFNFTSKIFSEYVNINKEKTFCDYVKIQNREECLKTYVLISN